MEDGSGMTPQDFVDTAAEGEEYYELLAHTKSYLPFLKKITNTKTLGIREKNLKKLQSLYEMIDSNRLSITKLKSCQSVIHSLYSQYNSVLSKNQEDTNNSKNLIQLNKDENRTKSLEVELISNKSDQKINSKSELSSKMSLPSSIKNNILNNQLENNLEIDHEQNNDSIIKKILSPQKSGEPSSSKGELSMFTKDDSKSDFLDSRLRLNKVIGLAANASIEKLNKSDKNISYSELAKQIYDEIVKQSENTHKKTMYQNMLKGFNMDAIDVNVVKQVLESIKKTDIIESSSFLPMDSVADVKLISSIESKANHMTQDNVISTTPNYQSTCNMVPSKSTNIRDKLNNDINVLHKIGPSNESKQKFITALKPGTLIDLENSKVARTSLHIESLRPGNKLNEKITDVKSPVAEIIVPRDPRIRNKSLNLENINLIQSHLQTNVQQVIPLPIKPQIQNPGSVNIPSLLSLSIPNVKSTFFEPRLQEHLEPVNIVSQQEIYNALPGYNNGPTNYRNSPGHTNTQLLLNKQFPTEHSGSLIQSQFNNCRPLVQNPYKQNHRSDFTFDIQNNDFNQYSDSNRMNVNTVHHNETMRYHKPVMSSYKSFNNSIVKRDPRSMKSTQKLREPQFRNFREYREAKYGKNNSNSGFSKTKTGMNRNQDLYHTSNSESGKFKNSTKTVTKNMSHNNFGMLNDTANIKSFKIPKIKHKEEIETIKDNPEKNKMTELVNDNITERDTKLKTIKNNKEEDTKPKTIKDNNIEDTKPKTIKDNIEEDMKPKTIKDNNIEEDTKPKTIKDNIEENTKCKTIKDNNTEKGIKIEINKNRDTEKDLEFKQSMQMNERKLNDSNNSDINEVNIDSKQNCALNEPTKQLCKPKKPKKYSKEKEFEKIVKEAVESLLSNNDACGPKTRTTRSSLRKKENSLNCVNLRNTNSSSENRNEIAIEKCNKNLNDKCSEDFNGLIETEQNAISSTSKESSEIESLTEVVNKNCIENIVSSDEINSTADTTNNQKINGTLIMNILKTNPTLISIFQNENKVKKLNKLLESTEFENIVVDEIPKNKNIIKDHDDSEKYEKIRKKMKKEKKKMRKMKKNLSEKSSSEESKNEFLKQISDSDDINNDKKNTDHLSDDSEINSNSDNDYGHLLTDQVNSKSIKRKKSKEYYGNFKVRSDSCQTKENLKIIIAKSDENLVTENSNSDVSSSNIQTTNESIQSAKCKKPFFGPLSVKLAKQKKEIERNNHLQIDEETQPESETNTITKNKKENSKEIKNKNLKIISKTIEEIQDAYVVIEPIESAISEKASEETPSDSNLATTEQNVNKANLIVQNKSDIKKPRPKMTELEKLHADISEMYDSDKLLNIRNVRNCRTKNQIDYANTNHAIVSKKNNKSSVKQLDLHVDQNNKSKFVLNKNRPVAKKNSIKTVKTTINNKTNVLKPNKLVKLKSKISKKKTNKKLTKKKVTRKGSQLNVVQDVEVTTAVLSKVLTVNDFKDKSYFQTKDNTLECKFCNYKENGINIVRHYKKQHCNEEVLPSRLSTNCAEILINMSLTQHFGFSNVEQYEDIKSKCVSSNISFTCVFCQLNVNNFTIFYDHISSHTGEYRYKCKMCEEIHPNEYELEKHILKHSNYDKTDGISHLLQPYPIQKTILFGYLCSFCNYIQLNYNNIINHMTLRHFDEDKKFNGYWTVIRVNMSNVNECCENPIIDYNNLVGCLPPIQYKQDIHQDVSKNEVHGNKKQTNSATELQEKVSPTGNSVSINKEHCLQEIVEDSSKSNMFQLSPNQSDLSFNSKMNADDHMIENSEYTLKDGCTKCTVGGLSCELINSVLIFKCSVSRCLDNEFSTIILIDFFKHIELNHQFLVWDRKCDVCEHKIETISEQYFLKNALEHIIAHHLVLKKYVQSNMLKHVDLQKMQNEQDAPENTKLEKRPIIPLRIRNLPGDLLSNHEELSEHTVNNFEQSSHIELNNLFNTTADSTNINEVLEDNSLFMLPRIEDVKSLKKDLSTHTTDDNVNMWTKMETNNVILPDTSIMLEPGQCIINNGELINGTYCLRDTECKKDYFKKIQEFPMNVIKTRLAISEMTNLSRLLGLYKCMDRTCTKIFNQKELFKLHMQLHFFNTEKKKKNQSDNAEQFKKCVYCFKEFENVDALANHIEDNYTYCDYFCRYCFYRAYTPSHVLVHQQEIHKKLKPLIIKLEYNDTSDNELIRKELLIVVDFNKYILPFICNIGHCTFSCFLQSDYISHLNHEHKKCGTFCCYICANEDNCEGFYVLQSKLMINHFKLHNINVLQCIFCLFGTENIDTMVVHLAMEHFEYEPLCLERTPVSDTCDSKKIENLKIIKLNRGIENGLVQVVKLPPDTSSLPEILPQRHKKRRVDYPDKLSAAIESVIINKNAQLLSNTIVIKVPDKTQMINDYTSSTSAINNEFIMLDDAKNEPEMFKINNIWSETENNKVKPQMSHNDDVIIIDDENELLENNTSNKEENIEISNKQRCLTKQSVEESTDGLNKTKRLAHPLVPLANLFTCKGCGLILSNGNEYQSHLIKCLNFNNTFQCPFCIKVFKTALNMTEHVKLHGPDRFSCSVCNIKVSSCRAIIHHMKMKHKFMHLNFIPVNNDSIDMETDEFIVYEDKKIAKTTKAKNKVNISYTCELCSFKGNSKQVINLHIKNSHTINNYKEYTVDPPINNYTEECLIPIVDVLEPEQQKTGIKRKYINNSNSVGNKKKSKKTNDAIQEKPKTLLFSPQTIDTIPKLHIFSESIGCILCPYNTKVRSNLVLHLNGHKIGQDITAKEIVNPVPIKSELMFDKMINLSASSFEAMNTEKMKIIELNKKIVEVDFQGNLNLELYPPFVPKNRRYKCSIPSCTYTGMTEDMLKKHISILHPDCQCYICPHCLPSCTLNKVVPLNKIEFHLMHHSENLYSCQYCDYIDFNRVEMKTHIRHSHLALLTSENKSNIIVIRQTMLKDDSIDGNRLQARSVAAQWICNICSSGIKYTENEITSHIFMAHNVSNLFKCPMCQFEHQDDDIKVFEEHYKLEHPSVAVKSLRVFKKITDVEIEEQQKQIKRLFSAANTQEHQALDSIEPMSPTCRGIPIETTSTIKTYSKVRAASKSPRSASKNSSPFHGRKQKMFTDSFSVNDSLGTITSTGLFSCPRCNVFETMNIDHFREHLFKDVHFKIWKCMKCPEISDSPKKMAWHVKKHGDGSKYEKIESTEKLHWVEQVIVYQNTLIKEFKKKHTDKHLHSIEQNTTVVSDQQPCCSLLKKEEETDKNVLGSQKTHQPNDDVIDISDDSDDE